MDAINKRLTKKGEPPRTERYWTCRKRDGALPKLVKRFLKERKRCQEILMLEQSKPKDEQNPTIINEYDARQQTAKLLANAAFGVYGNPNFKYANYKVAETITAAGWMIHEDMIKLCSDERYTCQFFNLHVYSILNECSNIKYSMSSTMFLFCFIVILFSQEAFAQNSKEGSNSPNWYQILLSGIIAAIISARISAIVNYKVTITQIQSNHKNAMDQLSANYKNTLDQLKKERQVEVIKDKLKLYSAYLYKLKKTVGSTDFYPVATGDRLTTVIDNLKTAFDEIDSLLEEKFYLLNSQAINEWMLIVGNYQILYASGQLYFVAQFK
jgi:DNA polymerase family B